LKIWYDDHIIVVVNFCEREAVMFQNSSSASISFFVSLCQLYPCCQRSRKVGGDGYSNVVEDF